MIIFDNVSKKFFNDTYGVKEVSFAIKPGELVLVTGPTGSGKTTLMRLMTKEYEPDQGKIMFDNLDLSQVKPALLPQHRQRVGVVFQDYRLLPESNAWENIALPLLIAGQTQEKIEERVTDLLKLVSLTDKSDLFPRELSGGEAQRVSIARALATAPPVIFADEPTGNLDQETAKSILKLLKKINELGTTVILATHDVVVLDELDKARRLELNQGELTTDTQPKKIKPPLEEKNVSTKEEKVVEKKAKVKTEEKSSKKTDTSDKNQEKETKEKPEKKKKAKSKLKLPSFKLKKITP